MGKNDNPFAKKLRKLLKEYNAVISFSCDQLPYGETKNERMDIYLDNKVTYTIPGFSIRPDDI